MDIINDMLRKLGYVAFPVPLGYINYPLIFRLYKGEGVVLLHDNYRNLDSFDIFVTRNLNRYKTTIIPSFYGPTSCSTAKKFVKENPKFVHIGAEDTDHEEPANERIRREVDELLNSGFKLVRA
jgi:hypothetical protein